MATRVAIVGAGAIGAYVGAHMTKGGEDVVLIDQYPEHVEVMRTTGVKISGLLPRDDFSIKVNAMHICDVQALSKQKPIDIALITVKSYDTRWASAFIEPYLSKDGVVVSLQNCINEETIAGVVGRERTLGIAIAGLGVELFEPGRIKRTQVGLEGHVVFRAGELDGRITPRAEEVARAIKHADLSKTTGNLLGERWSKLIVNAMRNGLAGVTGMGGPEQDTNEITRAIMIQLGSETVRVGQALGYELVSTQGMTPEVLGRAGEGDAAALAEITGNLLAYSKQRTEDARPSMAQDIAKGRKTEIEQMNGMIAARGREKGVPTPMNEQITELVKKLERNEITPGLRAVEHLVPLSSRA